MEVLEKPKKIISVENPKHLPQKSTKNYGFYWLLVGLIFLMLGGVFLAIFSENTTENRYHFLENKILQNQELSESEKIEFCDLFFKIKGISLANCEKLGINELKTYITYKATVGQTTRKDYKATFFEKYPDLKGKVVVHHAIEQRVLHKYPTLFTESEIHSLKNLRGIYATNHNLHLSILRKEWNRFYIKNLSPTREDFLEFATYIDIKYGQQFLPKTPKNE